MSRPERVESILVVCETCRVPVFEGLHVQCRRDVRGRLYGALVPLARAREAICGGDDGE